MQSLRGYMANYSDMSYADVPMEHLNYEDETAPKNYLERIRELIENGDVGGYVSAFDRGFSGGFGRKVGGFINAVGSYPVDRMAEWLGYENVPTFSDRYNEIVQQADMNEEQLRQQHPYAAAGTEMLGNMFGLGNAAYGLAGRMGLKGVAQLGAAGAIDAATNTFGQADNINDALYNLPQNTAYGAVGGAVMGKLGEYGGYYGNKLLDWGQNKWTSGLRNRMQTALDQSAGHRVDIPQAMANRQQAYDNYIAQNANREVVDFTPTREQLLNYRPESTFNPNHNYTKEQAEQVLRNRVQRENMGIYNDKLSNLPNASDYRLGVNHFLSEKDVPNIRTFNNTKNNPDIRYSNNGRNYFIKKYNVDDENNFDFLITEGDNVFNKFKTNANYVENKLAEQVQDVSLQKRLLSDYGGETHSPVSLRTSASRNNIPLQSAVVNKNLPNVSGLYNGLTPSQAGLMDNALRQGLGQSAHKAGTLDSLDKIRHASYQQSGTPADLSAVQNRINNVMTPHTGHIDSKLAQAKRMEQYYRQGYQNQAITHGTGGQQFHSNLEKQAYLQGQLDRLAQSGQTAQEVLNNQALLQQFMPDYRYNRLYNKAQLSDDNYQSVLELRARYARHLLDMYNRSAPHEVNKITQK